MNDSTSVSEPGAKRGPGRPPEPGIVERRRGELVAAAYRVFARKGYAATGVADIVGELGVGRGTFYRYFDNKRDILLSVLDYGLDKIMSAVFGPESLEFVGTMTAETTPEQFIDSGREALTRLYTLLGEDPGLARVVLFELTGVDDELTQRLLSLNDMAAGVTESILIRAVELGLVNPELDTEMTAHMMNVALLPALVEALRGTLTTDKQERFVETAIKMMRSGLFAK